MIHIWKNNAGVIELPKGGLGLFKIIRIRKWEAKCYNCNKTINRNCYCMGDRGIKFCLECAPKVINNAIKSLKGYITTFERVERRLKEEKGEFSKHNLANSL